MVVRACLPIFNSSHIRFAKCWQSSSLFWWQLVKYASLYSSPCHRNCSYACKQAADNQIDKISFCFYCLQSTAYRPWYINSIYRETCLHSLHSHCSGSALRISFNNATQREFFPCLPLGPWRPECQRTGLWNKKRQGISHAPVQQSGQAGRHQRAELEEWLGLAFRADMKSTLIISKDIPT